MLFPRREPKLASYSGFAAIVMHTWVEASRIQVTWVAGNLKIAEVYFFLIPATDSSTATLLQLA